MIKITLRGNPLDEKGTIGYLVQSVLKEIQSTGKRSVKVRLTLAAPGAQPHDIDFRISVPQLKGASRRVRRPRMTSQKQEVSR